MSVDLYELIRRIYAEERDIVNSGTPGFDLYAVVHPADYDGIVRAADDLEFGVRYANAPRDPLNAIIGLPLEVDRGIAEFGYVYLRRRSNLYYTARVQIPSKPEPRAKPKPDNSPMIGGQQPEPTDNSPALPYWWAEWLALPEMNFTRAQYEAIEVCQEHPMDYRDGRTWKYLAPIPNRWIVAVMRRETESWRVDMYRPAIGDVD